MNPSTDQLDSFEAPRHRRLNEEFPQLAPAPYADEYNRIKTGTAIIFNQENFTVKACSKRDGSSKDRDDLLRTFKDLGFMVTVHDDLSVREVCNALKQELNHSESDCLVIVVMSHGDNGKLYAKDAEYPTRLLWQFFTAELCPSLAGKPKLFFIQACRGQSLHPAQTLRFSAQDEVDACSERFYTIPVMADILIMYSTAAGFFSWRDPKEGSYFVQSLVKQLKEHSRTRDLLSILTFVNREVAVDFTSFEPNAAELCNVKQMCSIVSMLTRLVYFHQYD